MDKDGYHSFQTVFGSHSRPKARTSDTHPLEIAYIKPLPTCGRIGITFCMGKVDRHSPGGAWHRDLEADVEAVRVWGASVVVTLIEDFEFDLLQVRGLADACRAAGLEWHHAPIVDVSVPSPAFEQRWVPLGRRLRDHLREGRSVVVHCRGGLGRAGLVAARLLVEFGHTPDDAIQLVRNVRPGAIETTEQEAYVRRQGRAND